MQETGISFGYIFFFLRIYKRISHLMTFSFKSRITIEGWNVRTLTGLSKLDSSLNEMKIYQMDMLGLSKINWLDQGEHFTQHDSLFIYSWNKQARRQWVGFLTATKARRSHLEAQLVSDSIIKARFKTKFRKVTLFQCYAPTEPDYDATKDILYDRLASSVNQTP